MVSAYGHLNSHQGFQIHHILTVFSDPRVPSLLNNIDCLRNLLCKGKGPIAVNLEMISVDK